MAGWTADDIPDLGGRLAVVTGANSGLGAITARELARAGARVVLACRDVSKGERVAAEIRDRTRGAQVEVAALDLAELASIREFAGRFAAAHEQLELLVNNAGVMAIPRRTTADGFEMQFGTNHLGHFALTGRLLDRLLAAPGARVVTVSSTAHRQAGGGLDFDDLQGERPYRRWTAYGRSKLANLLFAFELDRRVKAAGADLRSLAAHPGYAATNLQFAAPSMDGGVRGLLESTAMKMGNLLLAQSDEMGALPTLYTATMPDAEGGGYFGPDGIAEARGHPKPVGSSSAARDEQAARRLWEVSEQLTGVRYEPLAPATA